MDSRQSGGTAKRTAKALLKSEDIQSSRYCTQHQTVASVLLLSVSVWSCAVVCCLLYVYVCVLGGYQITSKQQFWLDVTSKLFVLNMHRLCLLELPIFVVS
jgi:hypothetical protein